MKVYNLQDLGGKEFIELVSGDDNDNYLIAPTGSGKSYFIRHMFYDYCKKHKCKVLYLLPRKAPLQQFEFELIKENKLSEDVTERYKDTIQLKTYQAIEQCYRLSQKPQELKAAEEQEIQEINLDKYDFIICDECHYFAQDSTFNPFTYISYALIYTSKARKIHITATPRLLQPYVVICNGVPFTEHYEDTPTMAIEHNEFKLAKQKSQIEKFIFTDVDTKERKENHYKTYISEILEKIPPEEKAIIFNGNIATLRELKKQYPNSILLHSTNNENNYLKPYELEKMEKDRMNLFVTGKFDAQFLFATNVLDVGFSIKDRAVKHIICTLTDITAIIQAIGRKRPEDTTDRYRVYLPDVNNRQLTARIEQAEKKLDHVYYLLSKGETEYLREYEQQPDPTQTVYTANEEIDTKYTEIPIYKTYVKINPQKLKYYKNTLDMLNEIKALNSRYKYAHYFHTEYNVPYEHTETAKDIRRKEKQQTQEQEIYKQLLQWIEEKKVFDKESKAELVKLIKYKTADYKIIKDIKKIAEYLKEKYKIDIIKETRTETIKENDKEIKKRITTYTLKEIE